MLEVKGIALNLKLGALAFERLEKRTVPVDLNWTGPLFSAGEPAVDYSLVCSCLKTTLKDEYLYIEELAADILGILKERWPGSWKVTVRKPQPPVDPPVSEASVTVGG
jgi:dihydroneopterin aldolase